MATNIPPGNRLRDGGDIHSFGVGGIVTSGYAIAGGGIHPLGACGITPCGYAIAGDGGFIATCGVPLVSHSALVACECALLNCLPVPHLLPQFGQILE